MNKPAVNIVLARVAETASIEHLSKIKVHSSIEVYDKNATLANTRAVMRHLQKRGFTNV